MERIQGNGLLIECVNPYIQKYIVRWDIQSIEEGLCDYYEHWFNHKPSIKEIKDIIISHYNKIIDEKIISGFVWKDMPIWLSSENQFNYKAAYDLAVQTQGMNLPIIFKFGTTENPVYYTFSTVQELSEFYLAAMQYINETLAEGWKVKDAIDWTEYEKLLE